MSTRLVGLLRVLLAAVLVLLLVLAVVVGQRTVDLEHLGVQLVALTGLLVLLWLYNRRWR